MNPGTPLPKPTRPSKRLGDDINGLPENVPNATNVSRTGQFRTV